MIAIPLILVLLLFFGTSSLSAQEATAEAVVPPVEVHILSETPPTTCTDNGWYYPYEASTPVQPPLVSWRLAPTRYVIQWVDGDVNLVHYWNSGYSAYVQDYSGYPNGPFEYIAGGYTIPLPDDTYEAVTSEYVLSGDEIVWETRVELTCEAGVVTHVTFTSQAATGYRADLPVPGGNLVLALEDIPRYRDALAETDLVGTIQACQTFFMSNIYMPRASIFTWGTDSITGEPMLLGGVADLPKLIDVPEDYGQPGGTPIIDGCTGA